MPTWSGTRKKLEEDYLCPALRGRLRYFATAYRKFHDQEGRVAVLLDGEEILGCGFCEYDRAYQKNYNDIVSETGVSGIDSHYPAVQRTLEEGFFERWSFYEAFHAFEGQSIETSLADDDPVVRMFALLDRRTGKRRLLAMHDRMKAEPSWLQMIYNLRLSAEGLSEHPGDL